MRLACRCWAAWRRSSSRRGRRGAATGAPRLLRSCRRWFSPPALSSPTAMPEVPPSHLMLCSATGSGRGKHVFRHEQMVCSSKMDVQRSVPLLRPAQTPCPVSELPLPVPLQVPRLHCCCGSRRGRQRRPPARSHRCRARRRRRRWLRRRGSLAPVRPGRKRWPILATPGRQCRSAHCNGQTRMRKLWPSAASRVTEGSGIVATSA